VRGGVLLGDALPVGDRLIGATSPDRLRGWMSIEERRGVVLVGAVCWGVVSAPPCSMAAVVLVWVTESEESATVAFVGRSQAADRFGMVTVRHAAVASSGESSADIANESDRGTACRSDDLLSEMRAPSTPRQFYSLAF
jgi:hypothetical protein